MNFMERMAEGARDNAFTMGQEVIALLREIRDRAGEGKAARETFFQRPFTFDIIGGTGQGDWTLPGGVGLKPSSLAVLSPGTGGRVVVYAGPPSPATLLKVHPLPGAAIAGAILDTDNFGADDYIPQNARITVVVEGVTGDGRASVVIRGKLFIEADARTTTHSE